MSVRALGQEEAQDDADAEAQQRPPCGAPPEREPLTAAHGGWLDPEEWQGARILPRPWQCGVFGTLVFVSVAGGLWLVGELGPVAHTIFHFTAVWLLVGSFVIMAFSLFVWYIETRLRLLMEHGAALRAYARELPRHMSGEVVTEVKAMERRLVDSITQLPTSIKSALKSALAEHAPHMPEHAPHLPHKGHNSSGKAKK